MAYFTWSDDLSVKILSIDEQHKKLINMINEFYDSFKSGSSKENLNKLIVGLKDYTVYHFTAEEELLTRFGYLDFENHKKQHVLFMEKVNDFQERIQSGKMVVSVEVTNFLKDWLVNHIMVTDKGYSALLTANGVK